MEDAGLELLRLHLPGAMMGLNPPPPPLRSGWRSRLHCLYCDTPSKHSERCPNCGATAVRDCSWVAPRVVPPPIRAECPDVPWFVIGLATACAITFVIVYLTAGAFL